MESNTRVRFALCPPAGAFDPRLAQILFLGILLASGAWLRDFSLRPLQIALTFGCGVACQNLCERLIGRPTRSLLSATITAFSVTLLLRAVQWWVHPLAVMAAILSKFLLRWRGKHLFNPANFGVLFALIFLPGAWISAGQWGQDVAFAGWMVGMGGIVTRAVRRGDISWTFLVLYVGALAARVMWLGQRWAVLGHQLSNGSLLLFAFFMISDPMTIPNDWRGRAAHAALVCAIGYAWQFYFYFNNGLLWALLIASPAVALWDTLWPAPKFRWDSKGGINDGAAQSVSVTGDRIYDLDSGLGHAAASGRILRVLRG